LLWTLILHKRMGFAAVVALRIKKKVDPEKLRLFHQVDSSRLLPSFG
jgi:hypothetical protein